MNAASPSDSTVCDIDNWPPYGNLRSNWQRQIFEVPVPSEFRLAGRLATGREFADYVLSEATAMADWLWPTYDPQKQKWVGAARSNAHALTLTDLAAMRVLRNYLTKQATCGSEGLKLTHGDLFLLEDTSAKPTLEIYVPGLPGDLLNKVRNGVDEGLKRAGTTWLQFKQLFQRPRPYQVSYLLRQPFDFEHAASAASASMISGHSFQGLLARTTALLLHRDALEKEAPDAVARLLQYCVDIGDRRVFAGVHYPSDNISSWYCCLRLCKYQFGNDGSLAKRLMWEAIKNKSIVFKYISGVAEKDPTSPYAGLIKMIEKEAAVDGAR